MHKLSKKAKNNNFWTIFSVFDKFQPSPLIFWGVTSVTSFVVDDPPPPHQQETLNSLYLGRFSSEWTEIWHDDFLDDIGQA